MNKYRYRKIYSSSPGLFLYPILQAADILLYKVQKISKLKKNVLSLFIFVAAVLPVTPNNYFDNAEQFESTGTGGKLLIFTGTGTLLKS